MCVTKEKALFLVRSEFEDAAGKFGTFSSGHEGYAVIKEELEELWDAVKSDQADNIIEREAIQVGAMAVRYLVDLIA